ncbi:MAG: carbohydrate ABC transporter permease [Anaerolineales bacterium]
MNHTPKPAEKSRGGLVIAKHRFVLSVTIPLLLYQSIGVFVLGWAFVLMFFQYSPGRAGGPILGLGGSNPFIGLDHFATMLKGVSLEAKLFRTSLGNTLIFAFAVLPLNLLITLPLAWLLDSIGSRFQATFRTIYFLPVLTSSVGVALVWMSLYHPQSGWINQIIRFFGGTPVAWLSDPRAGFLGVSVAMWAVILAYLWQDYGYNMVIFIAALQNIPSELKEAAMIDGATAWQVFTRVTVPLIRPTLLFVCVMTMLSSFQVFDIIQVMTNGDPSNQTQVLMLDIYKNAFRYQRLGFAAAESFVLFLIVMGVTLFQMRVLRTDWEY